MIKKMLAMASITLLTLTACNTSPKIQGKDDLKITTSLYPLAFIAENLAQGRADIELMVPAGGEPHDFEPTPGQIVSLLDSDLVLAVGTGMEPWLEDLREELVKRNVALLVMNDHLKTPLIQNSKEEHHEEEHHEEEPGEWDPHTWIDPLIMMELVTQVADALETLDPNGASLYQARADHLRAELQALYQSTKNQFEQCKKDTILVSHNAFAYAAKRYGIQVLSVAGLSPDAEPAVGELTELIETAKAKNLKFILMETLATPDVAEILAKEAHLTPLTLNPLEGLTLEELAAGENYLSISKKNSDNLAIALECTHP